MKIEVSNKRLDTLGRSEWDIIASPKTKRQAFVIAKKASKKSIETEVLFTDDEGDVCGHYYFEGGKLKIDMGL